MAQRMSRKFRVARPLFAKPGSMNITARPALLLGRASQNVAGSVYLSFGRFLSPHATCGKRSICYAAANAPASRSPAISAWL